MRAEVIGKGMACHVHWALPVLDNCGNGLKRHCSRFTCCPAQQSVPPIQSSEPPAEDEPILPPEEITDLKAVQTASHMIPSQPLVDPDELFERMQDEVRARTRH